MPKSSYIVGSDPARADLVIDHESLSRRHLSLRFDGGDEFVIKDLGSTNGTRVDGIELEANVPYAVEEGDEVAMGRYTTTVGALWASARKSETLAGKSVKELPPPKIVEEVKVGFGILTIGRVEGNDLQIDEVRVSSQHAAVYQNAGRLIIEDLGSRNGTHYWDPKAKEWTALKRAFLDPGDKIRIGSRHLTFTVEAREELTSVFVDIKNLDVTVTHNETGQPLKLLDDVSFTARPGEIVGIMGPSGSGKTTLLDVLAGFASPSSGEVLLDNQPLYRGGERSPELAGLIGHAPQFDVVHELLSVEDAVRFSALLHSDASLTGAKIQEQTAQAIADVDLSDKAGTMVGSHKTRKTLSGGQRKRVNIAMELVNDPKVLLLDEPTSGLSSHDTAELMKLLRKLADKSGRTIILTIHQPSFSSFILMDRILILEEGGHVAYFGPAAVTSFDYFGVIGREPEALLETLEKKPSREQKGVWASTYLESDLRKKDIAQREARLQRQPPAPAPRRKRGAFSQLFQLLARGFSVKRRDMFFLSLSCIVPVLVSLLFYWVLNAELEEPDIWSKTRAVIEHNYLVVLTIMTCFFGALSSALEILEETSILKRDRRGGLSLLSYIVSKAGLFVVPAMLFPALALSTLWLLPSKQVFEGGLFGYWLVLAPTFFASSCVGLMISTMFRTSQLAVIVAVFYTIVQVVFAVFAPLHITMEIEGSGDEKEEASKSDDTDAGSDEKKKKGDDDELFTIEVAGFSTFSQPAFSPDSKHLAMVATPAGADASDKNQKYALILSDKHGDNTRVVLKDSLFRNSDITWAPDNKTLFVMTEKGIYTFDTESNELELTIDRLTGSSFHVSLDGEKLAIATPIEQRGGKLDWPPDYRIKLADLDPPEDEEDDEKADDDDDNKEKVPSLVAGKSPLWIGALPITARWALGGLVVQSDLCHDDAIAEDDQEDAASDDRKVRIEWETFTERCQRDFYANHGVWVNDTREERTDEKHMLHALLVNLMVSLAALIATGLMLWKKK